MQEVAHNCNNDGTVYKTTRVCGSVMHPRFEFKRNRIIRGGVIDDSANYPGPFTDQFCPG